MVEEKKLQESRMARGRPREFDREQALREALKLFWEQGYMQTTMIQLCKAMGIKSPSLYCAFGSKAALFLEALKYYKESYWRKAFKAFINSPELYAGTKELFIETAKILLLPDAPCGCLTVFSALTLPANEEKILSAITSIRKETKKMFRERLMRAIQCGEIAPDSNVPAIAGALTNFFEGLTLQARDKDLCLAELTEIALMALHLLPPCNSTK